MPVGDPTQCHAVAIDARAPKFDGGIATRLDSIIFGIVVNRDAQRFYDEGEDTWPKRYAIWGRLVAQQPDQIAYTIVDFEIRSISSCRRSFRPFSADHRRSRGKLGLRRRRWKKPWRDFNAAVRPGTFDHTPARRLQH